MAVAFDVATTAVAYTATGTQTTSHVASASARAAVVMIAQNASAVDQVSTVTYGGVVMNAVSRQSEPTEAGAVGIYWLDNIAPGTQDVAMTTTGAANKQVCVATMTAAAGYKVVMAATNFGTSASVANPSWDLTGMGAYDGVGLACFEVIHSGLTTMTTTPHAGWTRISSTDLGSQGRGFAYGEIAPVAGVIGCGWVATTADDFVGASVAFAEVADVPGIPNPPAVGIGPEWFDITMPAALPSGADSFQLYEDGVLIQTGLGVSDAIRTGYHDPTVVYSYMLRAEGAGGTSADSVVTTEAPNPGAPTGLTVTPGETSIVVNWDVKPYAATCYLYRDDVLVYSANTGVHNDVELLPETQYAYRVFVQVLTPTARNSADALVSCTTLATVVVVRNPDLVFDVGGPSLTEQREDMVAFQPVGAASPCTIRGIRTPTISWSSAETTWAGLELLPPLWLSLMEASEFTIYLESPYAPGPAKNFVPPQWPYGGLYIGTGIWIQGVLDESYIPHEMAHHVGFVLRAQVGLSSLFGAAQINDAANVLADEVLVSAQAVQATHGGTGAIYGATNIVELVAESYRYLIMANSDPAWLAMGVSAWWPSGVRCDEYILTLCGGDTDLAARWLAELTQPEIWPAAPWPAHRTMASQSVIDNRRNSVTIPIQNLDSNEGPTLLLADATNGYRYATEPGGIGWVITKWIRSDRPLSVTVGALEVSVGSPTAELTNRYVGVGDGDAIHAVQLLGGPSETWRTTVTFLVGELLAVESILWHAIETSSGGIETEYALTWNGATVSASLTRRTGTGGAVIDTTTVTSGNVLVVGERCTVQAVWGGQGAAITLRHRTASAVAVTELTSAVMPAGRLAVGSWSMPMPHGPNGLTLSYAALAAVSVETIHDGGVGPMTWMDAEYA